MPNRWAHDLAVVNVSLVWILYSIFFVVPFLPMVSILFGILLGVFVSPDLDLAENYKGWWGLLWKPYGKLFKHPTRKRLNRPGKSHFPIFGTLTRAIYILIPIILILIWLDFDFSTFPYMFVLRSFIGLCIADIIHLLLDLIF